MKIESLLLLIGAAAFLIPKEIVSGSPVFRMEQRTADFGTVPEFTTATVFLVVGNDGNEPLTLRIQRDGCCWEQDVQINYPPVVLPSQEQEIGFKLEPTLGRRHFSGRFVVATNDPLQTQVALDVQGRVHRSARLVPSRLLFCLWGDNPEVRSAVLTNLRGESYFLRANCAHPAFEVQSVVLLSQCVIHIILDTSLWEQAIEHPAELVVEWMEWGEVQRAVIPIALNSCRERK